MLTVFGLKNCDICRKATKWLTAENKAHTFHDVRKNGIDRGMVAGWVQAVGWETLLNKRGTTWRGLSNAEKDGVDEIRATDLMTEHPALIKRPVFDQDGKISVGFKEADKVELLLGVTALIIR
jgi:Spx/MgsR family transcriptional regulator